MAGEESIIRDIEFLIRSLVRVRLVLSLDANNFLETFEQYRSARRPSDTLYTLYNFDMKYQDVIWDLLAFKTVKERYPEAIVEYEQSLKEARELCTSLNGRDIKIDHVDFEFYCDLLPQGQAGGANERLYFNPKPSQIHSVIRFILSTFNQYLQMGKSPGRNGFKFWYASSIGNLVRSDKIVFYGKNPELVRFIISKCHEIQHLMEQDIPKLTYRITSGIGFARSLEEHHLRQLKQENISYGQFVSLVIARSVGDYIHAYRQIFQQRVAEFYTRFKSEAERTTVTRQWLILSDSDIQKLALRIFNDEFISRHRWNFLP